MCYSFESSIYTFIFSVVSSLLLYKKNEIFAAAFVFVLGLMQLSDAIIWYNLKNNKTNIQISKYIIPTILCLQVVILYVAYIRVCSATHRSLVYEICLGTYVILQLYYWIKNCKKPTKKDSTSFLVWCDKPSKLNVTTFYQRALYLFFVLYPLYKVYNNNNPIKWIILTGVVMTYILNYKNKSFGARWCHTSNLISFFLLFYVYARK